MDIKTKVGVIAGVGTIAATAIVGEIVTLCKVNKVSKDVAKFNAEIDEASRYVNVDVPNKLVAAAMDRAANAEALRAAALVASDAKAIVQSSVDKVIEKEKNNIEDSVRTELEKKINLVDIEDIKSKVVGKTSSSIANDVMSGMRFNTSYNNNDVAEVIRACKEANMASWEIENIVDKLKEA